MEGLPILSLMICSTRGVVVLAPTRTWAKQKGHAPCAITLIRSELPCRWILGRLVNWKHGHPSWCLPFHQSLLTPPPTTRRPANACRTSFVAVSQTRLLTSRCASTPMVRSTLCASIYFSSRSQASTVTSPRRICRLTQSRGCVRCLWRRGSLFTSVSSAKKELFDRGYH